MDYFVMWKDETPIRCNNLTEAAIVITAQESDGKMCSNAKHKQLIAPFSGCGNLF